MANAFFASAKARILGGDDDWDSDHRAILGDAADDDPNVAADDFLNDIASGARVATSSTIGSPTKTGGAAGAASVTFASFSGDVCEWLVVYGHTGTESTSGLTVKFDSLSWLPLTPSGGPVRVRWPLNRVFSIASLPTFPLVNSSSGRYTRTPQGAPFFQLIHRCDNLIESKTIEEAIEFVEAFPQYTTYMIHLVAKWVDDEGPDNAYGDPPFAGTVSPTSIDFTQPDDDYHHRAVHLARALHARGKLLLLRPVYPGFQDALNGGSPPNGYEGAIAAASNADLEDYGAYLGALNWPDNVEWLYFGDNASSTMQTRMAALRTGIESTDPLLTRRYRVHLNSASTSNDTGKGGVAGWSDDYVSIYTLNETFLGDYNPNPHAHALEAYADNPSGPPIFDVEPMGEAVPPVTGDDMLAGADFRKSMWEEYLSGVWGGVAHVPQTTSIAAFDANTQGRSDLAVLASFFSSVAWQDLVPNTGTGLVTSGGGTLGADTYKARALTADGSLGVIYITGGTTVTFNRALFNGTITAEWLDPTNGDRFAVTGSPFTNTGTATVVASSQRGNNAAGAPDWVLVLET